MKTMDDYKAFLDNVRAETGLAALTPDEDGLVTVSIDEKYNLNLQFVAATGKVLCFIEVATLSPDTPKAVYRDLLVGGLFGKDTAGGYFAVESETETVVYNYFFDLEDAAKDVEEFIRTIEKILQLCDVWAERIRRLLVGEEANGTCSTDVSPDFHFHPSMIRA